MGDESILRRIRNVALRAFDLGREFAAQNVLRVAAQRDDSNVVLATQKQAHRFFLHFNDFIGVEFDVRIAVVKRIGENLATHRGLRLEARHAPPQRVWREVQVTGMAKKKVLP